MRIAVALLACICLVSPLLAENKNYRNRKARINFLYPADWSIKEGGDSVTVSSPDGEASVTIRQFPNAEKTTACEQLQKRGEDLRLINLLPEDKRGLTAEQLRFLGVKDGCLGAYQVSENDRGLLSGVGYYASGKRAWLLEQKLLIASQEKYGAQISAIAVSFTTN